MKEIILKSFNSFAEAELARNLLEKHGIKSVIQRKGMAPGVAGNVDIAGAYLFVSEREVNKAKEILRENQEIN